MSTLQSTAPNHWGNERILHNLHVLYNHVGIDPVCVDRDGNLQVDHRGRFSRALSSTADCSKERICEVSIRTLRKALNAIESGDLDGEHLVQQVYPARQQWMEEEIHVGSWVNRRQVGLIICNKMYFKVPRISGVPDDQLTAEQLVCKKVETLTNMIALGRERFQSERTETHSFYDTDTDD